MEMKLEGISKRFRDLEHEMSNPEIVSNQKRFKNLTMEHSKLLPIVQKYKEYKKMKNELNDSGEMLNQENDEEMKQLLNDEIVKLNDKIKDYKDSLMLMVLPEDQSSGKDVIVEIRAGTGGEEAGLFAADLFRMYTKYIESQGWKLELIEASPTGIGGYKEIIFSVRGKEVWDNLKFESGGHRVQRVPTTEAGGRIHTSAVTVAVMVEPEDDEIEINQEDIRIDVYRASGHGGQSVNTTDSAVRITHTPTGLVVTCQDEKSQHKNKSKALRVLRARLLEKSKMDRMEKESEIRRSLVGSGDRSERIRTYNFPQSRITDHRIGLTLYSLESILTGELSELTSALKKSEIDQKMSEINNLPG